MTSGADQRDEDDRVHEDDHGREEHVDERPNARRAHEQPHEQDDLRGSSCAPVLSIVATPIGNLGDITARALDVLRSADRILAEDTRRTRGLLQHFGIRTPVSSLHAHTSSAKVGRLVEQLRKGGHFALVSDAGTPLLSDPGSELVREAIDRGITVTPVPGPSAIAAALAVAGVPAGDFWFTGFLPRKGDDRRQKLRAIAGFHGAIVLFEAPQRTQETLRQLAELTGPDRRVAICRELTKRYESVIRGPISEVVEQAGQLRGEVTLVMAGTGRFGSERVAVASHDVLVARAQALLDEGESPRDAARVLQAEHGLSRNDAYRLVQSARRGPSTPRDPDEPR